MRSTKLFTTIAGLALLAAALVPAAGTVTAGTAAAKPVCDGSGHCFDYEPLPPDVHTLTPLPLPPDPPLVIRP